MAHLITGYAGHEHILSEDDGSFNAAFIGDGQYVMEIGNQFAGSIINNNTIRIADGDGLMYGRHFRIKPNSYEDLTIETGSSGSNRTDLICMTYEKNASDGTEEVYLQVIKGTETTGTAAIPSYTNGNILDGAILNQMPLYKVEIKGVVLSKVTAMFETVPTFKQQAERYTRQIETVIENIQKDLFNSIYPIGSIYMSVNNTNPATLFGGTWVAWGAGKVPVGVNSSETEFSTVEKTGGSKTHTLTASQMPSHNHSFTPSGTIASNGEHSHDVYATFEKDGAIGGNRPSYYQAGTEMKSAAFRIESAGAHTHTFTGKAGSTGSAGSGNAHNNLQPYITCYMWKRTA